MSEGKLAAALVLALAGCGSSPSQEPITVGLLLSYSGNLAANSINSERALWMAIDAANRAGGISGLRVTVVARDTGSDPSKVTPPARQLVEAGAAIVIGPDTPELAVELKPLLGDRTLIMPSFATSSNFAKPRSWFVMGAPAVRVACELHEQLVADQRRTPLLIVAPTGYNSLLGWELTRAYGMSSVVLPTDESTNEMSVPRIIDMDNMGMTAKPDAYVLATMPASASSLLFALAAVGALDDPERWYLSPTLHTPALLETIPRGLLQGARGVAAGTGAGAHDFRSAFADRWQDQPLDDAYAFYDAAAVTVLALQRAMVRQGEIPAGNGLDEHIIAVTHAAGMPVKWDQLALGLQLLQAGEEVGYVGLSGGPLEFDTSGQTREASTSWWTIGPEGFGPLQKAGGCR
jgi:ABC-type branched-subunit amino acid transport system substrate-binding protein